MILNLFPFLLKFTFRRKHYFPFLLQTCRKHYLMMMTMMSRMRMMLVTLPALRLTVAVNQAEETSRQLHIVHPPTHPKCFCYELVAFLSQVVRKIPGVNIMVDADRPIRGGWQLCGPSNTLSILIAIGVASLLPILPILPTSIAL